MSAVTTSSPPQLIVQTEDATGVACDGYYDLPITTPAYIALVSDGSHAADVEAHRLRTELRRQILSLPGARLGGKSIPCRGRRPDFDCTAINRSYSKNVIVYVGSGSNSLPPAPKVVVPSHHLETLVMLPKGAAIPILPWTRPTTNVVYWLMSATEYWTDILAAAGLTATDARVFISYRRPDVSTLAEQLFEALAKRNVDVFVDRFRISAGVDFQQRILQELAHKSMVVVLESPGILSSEWTRYEIAVAKSARLGLLAVHIPGSPIVRDIDRSRRMEVSPFGGLLDSVELTAVVDRILAEHALSQIRRRRLLRQNMQRALNLAGVFQQRIIDGAIEVEPNSGSSTRYLVWLPSRPAELADYYLASHHVAAATSGVSIVAPAAHMVGDDRLRMRWLSRVANVRSFDEGQMLQVARAMKGEFL